MANQQETTQKSLEEIRKRLEQQSQSIEECRQKAEESQDEVENESKHLIADDGKHVKVNLLEHKRNDMI